MELSDIFAILGDRQRLRIVNLLSDGPLCVSHLQTVVGATQVAVSKKLAQLRERGLVECRKDQNWVVYSIPPPSLVLRLLKEEDTEELSLLVDKNREHLRRWTPWLDGAKSPSDQLKFIQRCSGCSI